MLSGIAGIAPDSAITQVPWLSNRTAPSEEQSQKLESVTEGVLFLNGPVLRVPAAASARPMSIDIWDRLRFVRIFRSFCFVLLVMNLVAF